MVLFALKRRPDDGEINCICTSIYRDAHRWNDNRSIIYLDQFRLLKTLLYLANGFNPLDYLHFWFIIIIHSTIIFEGLKLYIHILPGWKSRILISEQHQISSKRIYTPHIIRIFSKNAAHIFVVWNTHWK